jgi:hypothetical protein
MSIKVVNRSATTRLDHWCVHSGAWVGSGSYRSARFIACSWLWDRKGLYSPRL